VLPTTIKTALALPFDRNIAAKRLAEQINSYENVIRELNPKKRRDLLSSLERARIDNHWGSKLFLIPLIRYRSQWIGDLIYQYMHPAWEAYYIAMDKTQALYDLHRIAIALERYQREHQTYPETLDVLVPKFLDEIPLDIFTSRDTITYRRTETSFLLYSYGQNEKDDNGTPKDDKNGNSDIVVQF
jgi:Tfp pilus assembly protein PilE